MRDFSNNHDWLSINTATIRKQQGQEVSLTRIIDQCAAQGIRAISPWRDQVASVGLNHVAAQLRAHDMKLSGYCRGGFYPTADKQGLQAALDDNRRAIDEAKTLDAPCLVLVVGSLPGALEGKPMHKDIQRVRNEVHDGIAASLEYARSVGMSLAIEPLHPMQAAERACINTLEQALEICDELDPQRTGALGVALDVYHVWWDPKLRQQIERACINTLEQALDICDELDPQRTGALGVALDVYHVWWDPKLRQQIERAGKQRLLAYHVCDWLTPTQDLLSDRGMMGDGIVELRQLRSWVEDAGFDGFSEVEIFSQLNWWQRDGDEVLRTCIERHQSCV